MVAMKTDGRRPDFKRARRRPAAGSSCLISMIPEYASLMMFKSSSFVHYHASASLIDFNLVDYYPHFVDLISVY